MMHAVFNPIMKPVFKGVFPFTPKRLFANGEEGAWFEPFDLTTLYQTSAGNTSVTAAGQPVGLMLDKSQGLKIGPELVPNGTFDTNVSGWTESNANVSLSWESGAARVSNTVSTFGGITSSNFATVPGSSYILNIDILENSGNGAVVVARTSTGSNLGVLASLQAGSYSLIFTATTTSAYVLIGNTNNSTSNRLIDNVSVRELPRNHAIQATLAARPTINQTANGLYYLEDDEVDDALNWTAPAGNYTIAYLNTSGSITISTAQALSGATDVLLDPALVSYVAVDRPLNTSETYHLTRYFEGIIP